MSDLKYQSSEWIEIQKEMYEDENTPSIMDEFKEKEEMSTEQKIDYLCNLLRKSGTHESLVMPNAILLLQSCKANGKKVTDIEII